VRAAPQGPVSFRYPECRAMTDSEAVRSGPATLTLARVAEIVGGRVEGPQETLVADVAPIDEAGPSEMGFLALPRYVRFLDTSAAGSLLVASELEGHVPPTVPRVVVDRPYPALLALLAHLHPEHSAPAEVHATAVLGKRVRLGDGVRVEPYAVIGDDVSIGEGTAIGSHCVIGSCASIGSRSTLHPHVVLYADTMIGSDVVLHSGVRVGSDGFGYTTVGGTHHKMPQVGRAIIEDGVEIGANSTIDRGSLGDTVVGAGAKIDNLVQVAHNVKVGEGAQLAALVGIAGSTRIGRGAWLGGRASAINHLEIGDGARVAFGSTVMRDVPAGETVSGSPSRPHREQLRRQAHVGRLERLLARVERLERRVGVDSISLPSSSETRPREGE
jgi:UDP-3-O-[3-hydroxymyristoyl] glucosamine N-acyltransferase